MKGLLGAFFVASAIVTYREVSGGIRTPADAPIPLPLPSTYTAPILVYGGLALLPSSLGPIPGMVGWGLVVAMVLNLWTPGSKSLVVSKAAAKKPSTVAPLKAVS